MLSFTPSPETSPTVSSTSVPLFNMQRVENIPFSDLQWDAKTQQFIYSQHNLSDLQDDISWWSFDPIQGTQESYNQYSPYSRVDDKLKRKLGIYDDYASLSPSGEDMVFIQAKRKDLPGAPLPIYEFVDLWYADKTGGTSIKLGSLPLPYSKVIWLDDGQSVLVIIAERSLIFQTKKQIGPLAAQGKATEGGKSPSKPVSTP